MKHVKTALLIIFLAITLLITACAQDIPSPEKSPRSLKSVQPSLLPSTASMKDYRATPRQAPPQASTPKPYTSTQECIISMSEFMNEKEASIQSSLVYVMFEQGVTYEHAQQLLNNQGITSVQPYHIFKEILKLSDESITQSFTQGGMITFSALAGREIETACTITMLEGVRAATPDLTIQELKPGRQ